MSRFFSEKYSSLTPYVPGEQPKDTQYVKLNTNESPFPPPASVLEAAKTEAGRLQLYSDPEVALLTEKAAQTLGVKKSQVLMTNGSDEALNFAFMAFCDKTHPIAFPDVTYGFYSGVERDSVHANSLKRRFFRGGRRVRRIASKYRNREPECTDGACAFAGAN